MATGEGATLVIRKGDNLILARTGTRWEVLFVGGECEDDPEAVVVLVGPQFRVVPIPAVELLRNIASGRVHHIPFGRDTHPPLAIGHDPFSFIALS